MMNDISGTIARTKRQVVRAAAKNAFGVLLSLPWLAMGAFGLFMLSGSSSMALPPLYYGLVKSVAAVMIAWVADRSLFWKSPPQKHANEGEFMPQIRRAVIFLAVCHLLQMV